MSYQKALVTFIDILGFSELVAADKTGEQVLKLSQQLRRFATDLDGEAVARAARYIHFSDSVLRFTPLMDGTGWQSDREALVSELESLTYIQGELSNMGVLIRGGIAAGMAHADDSGIFGPAFIEAYKLESQHAIYPRIIVHPDLVAGNAEKSRSGLAIRAKDGVNLTRVAHDGFHFVDYFGNFPRELHSDSAAERDGYLPDYAVERKKLIESRVKGLPSLNGVRTKYTWLGRYHNEVVREQFGDGASSYLVDA